ncbi:MAG: ZIP family metal transporter, partial [Phycisphaerae bacterium]|nr:ZIP family metal transporter [Phycisphaerae bacterium]
MEWFYGLNAVYQALLATLFTWFVTALGAAVVIFTRRFSQRFLDCSLGMAAGVMIAASCWSLLIPSIEMSEGVGYGKLMWIPPLLGFLLGAAFIRLIDRVLPHLHPGLAVAEGPKTSWHRSTLLVLAITLHNIPEGLAVGVAFGAAAKFAGNAEAFNAQIGAAIALAIGIGLQNFPEGTAVAL